MKEKIMMALFCIFLIVFSSVNVSALGLERDERDDLGEIILINVANPEDMRISADYVRNKKFPLDIQLTGTTLESFLWGSNDAEELSTLFGGLKIERIHINRDSVSRYVSGINEVAPKGGYFVNPDGSVDLGHVKVDIRRMPKEEDLPDRIDLNFTVKIHFDTDSSFSVFGKQDLFLKLDSTKEEDKSVRDVWDGRARIEFLEIKGDKATFQVYDGASRKLGGPFTLRPGQQETIRLNDGPAFLDNKVRFKLQGIYGSEKEAKLNIYRNGNSRAVTLVEGMNLYSGSDWILEDIEKNQVELRNSKTREKIKLDMADLGEPEVDVCNNVRLLELSDKKLFLGGSDPIKGEDFEEKLNDESLSFYCSAIKQYEAALEYELGEKAAELKFKIAEIYLLLNDNENALENYESISSGTEFFKDENIQSKINDIKDLVSEGITNFKILDDGVRVYLIDIPVVGESDTYFDYVEIDDGVRQDERMGRLNGKSVIEGSGGDWYVDRIRPDEIVLVKKDDDGKQIGKPEIVDIGENLLEKDILIDIKEINTPYSVVVSAIPGDGRSYGVSHFQVHIPVEKSAIQWTPEQIDNMIEKSHKAVEDIENIMDKLGNFIKGMKVACFGIYSILAIKNSFFKDGGARKQVIDERAKFCNERISDDPDFPHKKFEECMEAYVDVDEKKITDLTKIKKETDELFKGFESTDTEQINKIAQKMGVDSLNLTKLIKHGQYTGVAPDEIKRLTELSLYDNEKFLKEWDGYSDKIDKAIELDAKIKADNVQDGDVKNIGVLAAPIFDSNKQTEKFGTEDQTTIQKVNAAYPEYVDKIYKAGSVTEGDNDAATTKVDGTLVKLTRPKDQYKVNFIEIDGYSVYEGDDGRIYLYKGKVNEPYVKGYAFNEDKKLEINEDGKLWIFPFQAKTKDTIYEKLDYANYVVVNYGNTGGIQSYQIYNVGSNGEVDHPNAVDDQPVVPYLLSVDDTRRNIKDGKSNQQMLELVLEIDAKYKDFTKKRLNAGTPVIYNSISYAVSNAASNSIGEASSRCENYMGPTDCALLYNFCDPVMCPASRFDLGNRWDVDNVVQTGIIGSLVLGMPNWVAINKKGENIFPPICLTGVHAGLDNVRSKFEGFEDCLQKAKTEGRDVGICNTIRSVYMCEILWREGLSIFGSLGKLADVVSERVFGIFGSEGWEYTRWQLSWNELRDNVNFFTSEYARSAFASYKARSLGEFGSEVCKAAIYGNVPGTGDFIGELLEPDSPYQFTAWFDELEYSEVEYGKSIYRIYYHIYAGRDEDVEYLVYLKGAGLSKLYVTNPERGIRREVLREGDYSDRSYTITGDSGYSTICVFINGQEYCGFGKVSSAFSSQYLQDMMLEDDLNRKDIDSAEECMPDSLQLTPYLPGVPAPALPGAGAISQTGVIRRCAMSDPDGAGTRWVDVGNCGTDEQGNSLGKCYLDYENSADFNDLKKKDEIAQEWIDKQTENAASDESLNIFNANLDEIDSKVDELISGIKDGAKPKEIDELLVYPAFYLNSADNKKDSGIYARSYGKVGDIYSALGSILKTKGSGDGIVVGDGEGENLDENIDKIEKFKIKFNIVSSNPLFGGIFDWVANNFEADWVIPVNQESESFWSIFGGFIGSNDKFIIGTGNNKDFQKGLEDIFDSYDRYYDFDSILDKDTGMLDKVNVEIEMKDGSRDSYEFTPLQFYQFEKDEFIEYILNSRTGSSSSWGKVADVIDVGKDIKIEADSTVWVNPTYNWRDGTWSDASLADLSFANGLDKIEKAFKEYLGDDFAEKDIYIVVYSDDESGEVILLDGGEFSGLVNYLVNNPSSSESDELAFYNILAETENLIEEEGLTSETQRSLDALYDSAVDAICLEEFPINMPCDFDNYEVCLDNLLDDVVDDLNEFSEALPDNTLVSGPDVEQIQEEIDEVILTPCHLEQGDPWDDFNDLVWQIRNSGINNGFRDKSCDCGTRYECDGFADYLQEYSEQRGIESTLAFALVIQESECDNTEISDSGAYGLWQITRTPFDEICDGDFDYIKWNVEGNIECGSKILKAKYNEYKDGVYDSWSYENNQDFVNIVDPCVDSYPKYGNYRGWEAALRGYNGWGCGSGADVNYVDKITTMFNSLEGNLDLVEVEGDYVDCTLFDDDLPRCGEERYCFIKENPWWELWNEYDCVTCFAASCDDIKDESKCSGDCGSVANCEWDVNECVDS